MTEIPEHLLKRAQRAREEAAGGSPPRDASSALRDEIASALEDVRSRIADMTRGSRPTSSIFGAPINKKSAAEEKQELIEKITKGLSEFLDEGDGTLLNFVIERNNGKLVVRLELDAAVMAALSVSLVDNLT